MLLLYPPSARSPEPPLGIARVAAFLESAGIPARCLDLNQEGLDYLLGLEAQAEGRRERGALQRRARNLAILRDGAACAVPDRYRRAVHELNLALKAVSAPACASLADYREPRRSPLRRSDLLDAAASFESNAFMPLFARRLEAELASSRPAAVGISLCFLSQALCAFAIAGYLKKSRPDLPIILGGGLIGSWAAQGVLDPRDGFGGLVDAIVPGRGEDGILEALSRLGVAGAGPASTRSARSEAPEFRDFEALPYLSPLRILPFSFSSGCPWRRCSFCPERAEGGAYLPLAREAAMGQVAGLVERWSPGLLHFTDNEVAPLYLRALAERPPGPRWYGFARFSSLLAEPAFCARLAASGCAMLQLGLESGDQAVLDALDKGIDLGLVDACLESLAAAGIATYLYVLFGTPAEDRDAALRTRDFLASRAGKIGFLNVAVFNLPATSEEAARLETKPFYEGELSLYREFLHPSGFGRAEVRSFLARDFEPEPAIRAILARNPPVFSSSHAALFPSPQPGASR